MCRAAFGKCGDRRDVHPIYCRPRIGDTPVCPRISSESCYRANPAARSLSFTNQKICPNFVAKNTASIPFRDSR